MFILSLDLDDKESTAKRSISKGAGPVKQMTLKNETQSCRLYKLLSWDSHMKTIRTKIFHPIYVEGKSKSRDSKTQMTIRQIRGYDVL